MRQPEIALIGHGYLGQAYQQVFPEALIYDEPKGMWAGRADMVAGRTAVNACKLGIVAVPTNLTAEKTLNMGIVEEVVDWLETDDILIKSALMPGTTDRLVEETGKNIAVSVELIGMGNYYIDPSEYPDPKDPRKHKTLIVGGEDGVATRSAERLWERMQPDIDIHIVTALEAEITKLVENAYPALKVSFINALYELTRQAGANFIRTHQAWSSDSRVDGFHMRTLSYKRGWASHCWDKDIPALATYAGNIGATTMKQLFETVLDINETHKAANDQDKTIS